MTWQADFYGGLAFLYLQIAESYRTASSQTRNFSLAISQTLGIWAEWRAFQAQQMREKATSTETQAIGKARVLPLPFIEDEDDPDKKAEEWTRHLASYEDALAKSLKASESTDADLREKIKDAEGRRDILGKLAEMIRQGQIWAYKEDLLWCEFCGYSWDGSPHSGCPYCHTEDLAYLTPLKLFLLLKGRQMSTQAYAGY